MRVFIKICHNRGGSQTGKMPEDFFDFKSVSEEEESLDYDHLLECPHCRKPIPKDATLCYYCGQEVYFNDKKSKFSYWVFLFIVALLVGYLIFF